MSGGVIKSGSNGNTAEVDSEGRLTTFAVTRTEDVSSAKDGQAFLITHPLVELTDDTESFVFYCKNDDTVSWILEDINASFGKSVSGDGAEFMSRTVIGATGGSILSGDDGAAINLRVGNPTVLPATVKSGAQDATATGGASLFPAIVVTDQMTARFIGGPIILPPSTSFAYAITPPAGNTSLKIKLSMLAFRELEE